MQRFDWQTEEEGPIWLTVPPAVRRKRTGLAAVIMVMGLLVVAALIVGQIGRRTKIQERAVTDDVQAAFSIWKNAIARKDIDLLDTLLLDGEAVWTVTQRELLTSGRSLDRSDLGLMQLERGLETASSNPEIEVSSDWREAEITFPVTYRLLENDGLPAEVKLEQTVAFARAGSRWLLRRPGDDFWGEWQNVKGNLVEVTFRERDAAIAGRFLKDLDRELGEVCAEVIDQDNCNSDRLLQVRLESEATALLRETDQDRPSFVGRTFVLPTPTLLGNPLDDAGYQALYAAYSTPIVATFQATLETPVDLPEQIVSLICFDQNGRLPQLFSYDPARDWWSNELDGSYFRYLAADESDSAIVLRQHTPGEPSRLRLVRWSADRANVIHDEVYGAVTDHAIGWLESPEKASLLLLEYHGTTRKPSYQLIDVDRIGSLACPIGGCPPKILDGFPRWSPDGLHKLVLVDGRLYLADQDNRVKIELGEGQNPFWIDEKRFGFVRPSAKGQVRSEELVVGTADRPKLVSIWNTEEVNESMLGTTADTPFFVQYVTPAGSGPPRLMVYGRQYAGEESRYAVLSLELADNEGNGEQARLASPARVELVLDKVPAGIPSVADPNGHVPFVVSPNGRWLTVAYLAEEGASEWVIQVVEIGRDNGLQVTARYPGYSFNHPFFDWSADGRWLLVVDQEFLRLVAPEASFERIVAHDKTSCAYPAWIYPQAGQ